MESTTTERPRLPEGLVDLRLDEGRTVAADVQCSECDYNLRGLSPDAACPECGMFVGRTLYPSTLVFRDHEWVDSAESAAAMVRRFYWIALIGTLVTPLGILAVLVALRSVWMLTDTGPGNPDESHRSWRKDARQFAVGAAIVIAISVVALLNAFSSMGQSATPTLAVPLLPQIGSVLGWWALVLLTTAVFRDVLQRMGELGLAAMIKGAFPLLITAGVVAAGAILLSNLLDNGQPQAPVDGLYDLARVGAAIVSLLFQLAAFYRMIVVSGTIVGRLREAVGVSKSIVRRGDAPAGAK